MTNPIGSLSHKVLDLSQVRQYQANQLNTNINNANTIKLDRLTLSDAVGDIEKSSNQQKLEVSIVKEKSEIEFEDFFQRIIEGSNELSKEEKKNVSTIIQDTIKKNENYFDSGWTSNTASMYHIQTKEKLQLISGKLLPQSMKEEMGRAIEKYTDHKLEQTVNVSLETYQRIYEKYKNDDGPMGRFADQLNGAIQEIEEGSHITQREQMQYESLYSKLNDLDAASFRQSYERVMAGYAEIQQQQLGAHWNNTSRTQTEMNIRRLRDDWNNFVNNMSSLEGYQVYSHSSSILDNKV
ncbi:hypothetical protein MUN89_15940 [Halobacillus salinarum]|uniref:Flagellar hook-associated protein 1 n=1 Tax=Halobacillus salinarum TaxID=2932257 RepID=A0ABY4EHC0_9BACI|nr:hypothetical protein [Halobacillus salinarum]UOQ43400.1 hypothetical protein MUN89_15940 [Halobacillus salinarum]